MPGLVRAQAKSGTGRDFDCRADQESRDCFHRSESQSGFIVSAIF